MSNQLSIDNVIRVTLVLGERTLAPFNTSNLAIITDEEPSPTNFGVFRSYLGPGGVGDDFGSDSTTFALANAVFNQTPNINTGRGSLKVIPRLQAADATSAKLLSSSRVDLTALTADDYHINVAIDGSPAEDLEIGEIDTSDVESAEASLNSQAVSGAGISFSVTGELTAATIELSSDSTGETSTLEIDESSTGTDIASLLNLSGSAAGSDAGLESVKDTLLRVRDKVDFFGIVYTQKVVDVLDDIAPIVQALDKIQFVTSESEADIDGAFTDMRDAGFNQTRCLFYSEGESDALEFAAAYAGRALSINFDGINTAHTMHLKELTGITPDSGMSQTLLQNAKNKGVDVYVDFGVPKLFTSGANGFFDAVYIAIAFRLRLQVAAFNFLAGTSTKIPQTEQGMNGFKGELRDVCARFVENGSFAPGEWNQPVPFGDPEDFKENIREQGFYVFSLPVAGQAQAMREKRVAPQLSLATKSAGAIHSADIVAQIEA